MKSILLRTHICILSRKYDSRKWNDFIQGVIIQYIPELHDALTLDTCYCFLDPYAKYSPSLHQHLTKKAGYLKYSWKYIFVHCL